MAAAATDIPELSISMDKVCFLIAKAEEFDAKDVVTESDPGSNPSDDAMIGVLEDHKDDPVVAELVGFIHAMSEDEQIDLAPPTLVVQSCPDAMCDRSTNFSANLTNSRRTRIAASDAASLDAHGKTRTRRVRVCLCALRQRASSPRSQTVAVRLAEPRL